MMVIMIGGKARVGKTTVANWFSKYVFEQGYSPVMLPFAAILKSEVEKTGLTKEKNAVEYRLACQVLGSTKRKEDPDYWVKLFSDKLTEIKKNDIENLERDHTNWHEKCVIVDDCRYLNEVGFGRKIGALEIFIAHGNRKLQDHSGEWRKHESEDMANRVELGELDFQNMFHYRLINGATEAEFKKRITCLFKDWLEYGQDDERDLCKCIACVANRTDTEISQEALDNVIKELHKELERSDDDNEQSNDSN